eukprot:555887_1
MAQSSQPAGWSLSKHLIALLKVNDNGWNVSLFQNQNVVDTALCGNCKEVCRDAVELGCDHDDDDAIVLFCDSCLKDLISTNGNKCPINQHLDPILSPVRSARRQILKSAVLCPYSVEYKRRNKNVNIDNEVVMDTIGCDQKEGAPVAAASDDIVDGCQWKGTLDALLKSDHLRECSLKYDATGIQKLQMEEMQHENQSLQQIIQQQKQTIQSLQANVKDNQHFKQQLEAKTHAITDLEAENTMHQQTIQELRAKVQDINRLKQQLEVTHRAEKVTHQERIQSLQTNVQDTQRLRQQLEAKQKTQQQQIQAKTRMISALESEKRTQQEMIQELHSNVANLSADQQRNVVQLKKSLSLSSNDNSQRFAWLRSEDDEKKENDLELVKIVADNPIRIAFVDGKQQKSANDVLSPTPTVNSIDGICKCNKQMLNGVKTLMKDVRDDGIRRRDDENVRNFVYSSDFDRNGICCALGTHFGTKQWRNPMELGLITVHSSNEVNGFNHTYNEENVSIVICFNNGSIQPTAYTWRHDTLGDGYPRNWDFSGSNDSVTWDILKRHVNDDDHGINAPKASHTWTITNCHKYYKMFRFKSTGKNSGGWSDAIHCGGFEIYGRLKS